MTGHLSEMTLNCLIDNELPPAEIAAAEAHLAACPSCTTNALSYTLLKSRTARAGVRYTLPSQLLNRRPPYATESPEGRSSLAPWAAAIVAALIVIAGMTFLQRRSIERTTEAAFATELTDQHVSAMAANQPPEVLSSDRHTVKPWFQGKIPFSFNLPEALPPDNALDGANLAYLGHRPAVQLLYSVGKHRVSVFIRESAGGQSDPGTGQAGFHLRSFHAASLEVIAVSDVDPVKLDALTAAIRSAQTQ